MWRISTVHNVQLKDTIELWDKIISKTLELYFFWILYSTFYLYVNIIVVKKSVRYSRLPFTVMYAVLLFLHCFSIPSKPLVESTVKIHYYLYSLQPISFLTSATWQTTANTTIMNLSITTKKKWVERKPLFCVNIIIIIIWKKRIMFIATIASSIMKRGNKISFGHAPKKIFLAQTVLVLVSTYDPDLHTWYY